MRANMKWTLQELEQKVNTTLEMCSRYGGMLWSVMSPTSYQGRFYQIVPYLSELLRGCTSSQPVMGLCFVTAG